MCGNDTRHGTLAFQQGIGPHGGAMDDGRQVRKIVDLLPNTFNKPDGLVGAGRRHLGDFTVAGGLVEEKDVCESAANVDTNHIF